MPQNETISMILADANWLLAVASLLVGLFFADRVKKEKVSGMARDIAIGVIWVAIGLTIHRVWWALWRFFDGAGQEAQSSFFATYSLASIVPLMAIIWGYGHHLSPVLQKYLGRYHMAKYAAGVSTVYLAMVCLSIC